MQNPFAGRARAGPSEHGDGEGHPHRGHPGQAGAGRDRESRLGRFQLSGRSNSAPGAYGWARERQVSVDIPSGPALPAVREVSTAEPAEAAEASGPTSSSATTTIPEEAAS